MSRRPYIDQHMIRDEYRAIATHSNDGGYRSHCPGYEVVGMDGRNDWFRWHCRECERKFISLRAEKSMKYYKCPDCDELRFVYKGFFTQPDRKNGSETVPLKPSEVEGVLAKCKLAYAPSDFDRDGSWHYANPETLQEKIQDSDTWEVVEPIQAVGKEALEA